MPKNLPALTSATVMNLRPASGQSRVEVGDGKVEGLRLRVYADGDRLWSLMIFGTDGKRRRVLVGKGLGLAEARQKAIELKVASAKGETLPRPSSRGAKNETAPEQATTFLDVVDAYEQAVGNERKSWASMRNTLMSVFGTLMSRPALSLDESDFLLAADKYKARQHAASASR